MLWCLWITAVGRCHSATGFAATTSGINAANGEQYALETSSSEITDTDRRVSIQFYDNLQRTVRAQARRYVDGGGWDTAEARTFFDGLGRQRCTAKQVAGGAVSGSTTCAGVSWNGIATGSAVTRMDYDALNRVKSETLPDGNTVTTNYAGLTTTVTRTNGIAGPAGSIGSDQPHVTIKTANAKGLVATVVTSPIATTVSYLYDAIGNLTQVDSPGANGGTLTKTMVYDTRGRQTRLVDPDAGTYNYTYNGAGEQRTQSDLRNGATGFVTTTTYDAFGRKTTRTETQATGGDATTTWSYDCVNGKGLLCSVNYSGTGTASPTNATSKTTTYDQYSRPVATSTVIAGLTFVSQVAYDGLGRPRYSVYPQATSAAAPLALKQTYNIYGFATQTENASTGFVYSSITSRNDDGQVYQASLGGGLLTHTNSYSNDGLGRIASINITGGASLTQSFGFESVGNLNSRSLTGGGRTETENFGYDALDRLIQTSGTSNGAALADTGSFGYDSAGNLNSKAGLLMGHASNTNSLCNIGANTACAARETNLANAAANAVVYDGNGNIQRYLRPLNAAMPGADGALLQLNGYTAFNLPTSITKSLAGTVAASAEFFYDAGYQRTRQIKRSGPTQTGSFVNDILYVVPGGFEVHRNEAGQVISSIAIVSGPDGVIATVTTNFDAITEAPVVGAGQAANTTNLSGITTVTKLLLKDHLGSMVAEFTLTSATTGTLAVHGFGPWGNARNAANPLNGDQRGFTGHEHLAELGIIHMNGRLYDAVLGRFLQADPIIQAPHNAQSHNRYSYVMNNPLSFTDPSGFSAWTRWRAPILAIAAALTMQYYLMPYLLAGAVASGAITAGTANFIHVVASGFASGGISGGNIQSALQGAFSAALFFGVGEMFNGVSGADKLGTLSNAGKIAAHAAAGCASAAAAGGSCRNGALSAGFAEGAGSSDLMPKGLVSGLVGRMIVGGIASRLSGGKFENGAMTAAFGYLFNFLAHKTVITQKNMATGELESTAYYAVEFSSTPNISAINDELSDFGGPKGRLKWLYRLGGISEGSGYGTSDLDGFDAKVKAYGLDPELKAVYTTLGYKQGDLLTAEQFRTFIAVATHTVEPDFRNTYGFIGEFISNVNKAYDKSIGGKILGAVRP